MCMITYLPPFVKVPVKGIMNGAQWNDDGHGWAVAAATDLMIRGRYMEAETALDTFLEVRERFPEAPALFHSRWATHGLPLVKNCHPFYVSGRDTVVAHNGVMPSWLCPVGKDTRSDTALMAQEWLGYQTRGTWTRKERKRVGAIIGSGNKLVILSVDPVFPKPKGFIVNQSSGHWARGGVWYSNRDYESGYTRQRALGSFSKQGTWMWNGSSDEQTNARRGGAYYAFGGDDECPACFAIGGVDRSQGLCTYCQFCVDCLEYLDVCSCWSGETLRDDNKNASADAIFREANATILKDLKAVDTNPDIGLFQEPNEDALGKALAIYDGDAAHDRQSSIVSIGRMNES